MSLLDERCLFLIVGLVIGMFATVYFCPHVKGYETVYASQSLVLNTTRHLMNSTHLNVSVLCWVMTSPKNLNTKALHVKETWGRRCNSLLFMSDEDNATFPAVGLGTPSGRKHLTKKSMRAFDYLYKYHLDDADWFLKADDDTYIIVENLKLMLSSFKPTDAIVSGQHFRASPNETHSSEDARMLPRGFVQGGAGYVLSKEALRRFGGRDEHLCDETRGYGTDEDVQMSRCLDLLNVTIADSRDSVGKSRFHALTPEEHLRGNFPVWYSHMEANGVKQGIESLSEFPISFHHIKTKHMYLLEYLVYGVSVHGVPCHTKHANGADEPNNHT